LEEHIDLIRENNIERAYIIAEDLSFIADCPSLKEFSIDPPNTFGNGYDYSPLYNHPNITNLDCRAVYGRKDEFSTVIDYSRVHGLRDLGVYGKGHQNFACVETLAKLFVSNAKDCTDMYQISRSANLKKPSLWLSGSRTLNGMEPYSEIQYVDLYNDRSLTDISNLVEASSALRALYIQGCPRITDFSCLYELTNLEHLELTGSNVLPDLRFLEKMKNLQTFYFSMQVADGDLSPCLQIPYVDCRKGRKEYNYKNKDLPKQKLIVPFSII
jgi:hypothetical protein